MNRRAATTNPLRLIAARVLGLSALLPALLAASEAWAQERTYDAAGEAANTGIAGNIWGFYIIGGLTLLGAVATITRRNPVVAAVCLVGTLVGTGGLYVLLHATFMAAIQVLVYAGAIMVLFVFVVMAVERPEEEEIGLGRALGTKVIGVIALVLLLLRLVPLVMGPEVRRVGAIVPSSFGTVEDVGRLLFSTYLFPFEAISILLLVAIVGAVVVTRHRREMERSESQ
jgi:NADH-quinone oxidoreductase subunit J